MFQSLQKVNDEVGMSESQRASLSHMMNVAMLFWLLMLLLSVGYWLQSELDPPHPVHMMTIEFEAASSNPLR